MTFKFKCPFCKSVRQASDHIRGRRVRCADCNNFVQVPYRKLDPENPSHLTSKSQTEDQEMNTNSESENQPDDDGFDLVPPTGRMKDESSERPDEKDPERSSLPVPPPVGALEDKKSMSWKGFEEEEEEEPEVDFKMIKDPSADEMDMTPMVDVTFLLLIFFMITASFTIIRSIEQPKPTSDDPSFQVIEEPEDKDEYVQVFIDQFNTYHITSRGAEEVEAASDLEMQRLIRQAVQDFNPERCVIIAHEESVLKKLIATYSAARVFGINSIEMQTTDRDY